MRVNGDGMAARAGALRQQACSPPPWCSCVYKGSWRGAPVAVKYIVCGTEDSDSLGRAIREVRWVAGRAAITTGAHQPTCALQVVLSKKMSHPNVVQCFSWTVLSGVGLGGAQPLHRAAKRQVVLVIAHPPAPPLCGRV